MNELRHQEREEMKALTRKLADAQATVEALQRERDEANLYRDQARANQESLAACVDRDVRKIKDLQAALDAEREKVKGLAQQVQDQSTANLETMRHTDDMQSRALDAERALAQLQALVRALPVVEGRIEYVNGRGWVVVTPGDVRALPELGKGLVAALLTYRAALDATTPAECTNHFTDGSKIFPSRNCCSKGGDGE